MATNTAAGSKVYIAVLSGAPHAGEPADLSAFEALTYVEIGHVTELGEYGEEKNVVETTELGNRVTQGVGGSINPGPIPITVNADPTDTGQQMMLAAFDTDFNYPFKIVLGDKLTNGGTGTTQYLHGIVTSRRRNVGNADTILTRNLAVRANSTITEVAAT